jgi:hypothetical protein
LAAPGKIVPAIVSVCPGLTGLGEMDALVFGGVGSELNVAAMLTLSIASPSSLPALSVSVHRIQIDVPGFTARPEIVAAMGILHVAVLPFVAPAAVVPETFKQDAARDAKFSAGTGVNVPAPSVAASRLYANDNLSPLGGTELPRRHISPSNEIVSAVIGPEPAFVNFAP